VQEPVPSPRALPLSLTNAESLVRAHVPDAFVGSLAWKDAAYRLSLLPTARCAPSSHLRGLALHFDRACQSNTRSVEHSIERAKELLLGMTA
jgi:hypothetical protein